MKRTLILLLMAVLCLSITAGCGKKIISTTTTSKTETTKSEAATVTKEQKSTEALLNINDIEKPQTDKITKGYQDKKVENGETVAIIHTSFGDISMKFFKEAAPLAVNNFIALAKDGRFDNTIFHRVIKDFMIQGGDYTNFNGTGGVSAYGKEFDNEVSNYLSNTRGSVAMANAGPNTNGSQFYINQNKSGNAYLDGSYTVFAQVYSGMDVVDEIAAVKTAGDKPLSDVVVESVEITEYKAD